jgi:hypothetical protein
MTENDNSWSQEDDSWRKTTGHVKWSLSSQVFLLSPQSSARITYLLTLNTDTRNLI